MEKTLNSDLIKAISEKKEVLWLNPACTAFAPQRRHLPLSFEEIIDAEQRLRRFAPFIALAFPETKSQNGLIESPLKEIRKMKAILSDHSDVPIEGRMFLKCDNILPVSGSIKARGGIYEVLKYAEKLAIENDLLSIEDDYSVLMENRFNDFFSDFTLTAGSTGNLGLSIGIMARALGFQVAIHMSSDAREWKKNLLRQNGAIVIEHTSDYSVAVEEARRQSADDPAIYFIDDENSKDLFLGYATAALRLRDQLEEASIVVDNQHPLFVYLPCGVGGGPGGISFGLKHLFGDHVHPFFSEPVASPCMLLGLLTGQHNQISVRDFGLDNKTAADGLAVGSPSGFVGKLIENILCGSFTVGDETLFRLVYLMKQSEGLFLEPSAVAGLPGPSRLSASGHLQTIMENVSPENATHLIWGTGGGMVPPDVAESYLKRGALLS